MIEFRNVSFRYDNAGEVLRDLTFSISSSGMTAVMGANGSGKSTAALCMNGSLVPDSGDVFVDGVTTRERARSSLTTRVGIVFQDPNHQFTSMTVEREVAFGLENLNTPPGEMHSRTDLALREFGLEAVRDQLPGDLSGGEKQRVALAAVAVLRPAYLVLDEATTLLSPATRTSVLAYARRDAERRGSALIVITQFPSEAMPADRLVVLNHGMLAFDGPPSLLHDRSVDLLRIGVPVLLRDRLLHDVA